MNKKNRFFTKKPHSKSEGAKTIFASIFFVFHKHIQPNPEADALLILIFLMKFAELLERFFLCPWCRVSMTL
jgi:hypothetical protein